MSAAPQRPDLSFLSDEEARTIFQVLQRDSELRRAEKDRVRYCEQVAGGAAPAGSAAPRPGHRQPRGPACCGRRGWEAAGRRAVALVSSVFSLVGERGAWRRDGAAGPCGTEGAFRCARPWTSRVQQPRVIADALCWQ